MSVLACEIRPGAYADSIVLLQLQRALSSLPGVIDAGVAMATEANLAILAEGDLLTGEAAEAKPEDLVLVVRAATGEEARAALDRVDELMTRKREGTTEGYRPKSLSAAVRMLPDARWVAVSVPGAWAARVAREALELDRNVFLYSDNVSLEDEVDLKRLAAERGLLVLGPDCGTTLVAGLGLGFSNRVRRGSIGMIAASGTGLQAVAVGIHRLGGGISHALGTGGRDLSAAVGGSTAVRALGLLADDPATTLLVLLSKPPEPAVAASLLRAARGTGKPVVVHFLGQAPPARRLGRLHFASSLDDAAELAVALLEENPAADPGHGPIGQPLPPPRGPYLRGLFAGGTLALQVQQSLLPFLGEIGSNAPAPGARAISGTAGCRGHAVLDLGADELTVGRLHPMLDQELRIRRLAVEAADPEVGVILLDVVLGDGATADPAAELAPAISKIRDAHGPEVVVLMIGTEDDPQDLEDQKKRLERAGARVFVELGATLEAVLDRLDDREESSAAPVMPVTRDALAEPCSVLNVGVESFAASFAAQGAPTLQVDWRPPAGGDSRLQMILERMRG